MTQNAFLDVIRQGLTLTLMLSAPPLIFGLAIGLLVSIFQTVTSINEMTLSYIPKIVAVFFALAVFGPWMLQMILSFTSQLFMSLPGLVR